MKKNLLNYDVHRKILAWTDPMEKPNLLIITHMYATFIKDQINQIAPRFSNIYVLVRTNPLAEISRIIPVPYLVPFSVAQKIDLSNKPENVHVCLLYTSPSPRDR